MADGTWDTSALKNQAMAYGRGGIWFAAGVAVGHGWLNGDTAISIAGAVLAVVGGGLTGIANTNRSITSAFSQIPAVKEIKVSDPALAEVAVKADPDTSVKVV